MTNVVIFAYSEVGVRCLRVLLHEAVHVALVVTQEDDGTKVVWQRHGAC